FIISIFLFSFFFFTSSRTPRFLHSFPTRRSSDLFPAPRLVCCIPLSLLDYFLGFLGSAPERSTRGCIAGNAAARRRPLHTRRGRDRKSTRLNSSHVAISYAVFCLKKKKKNIKLNL